MLRIEAGLDGRRRGVGVQEERPASRAGVMATRVLFGPSTLHAKCSSKFQATAHKRELVRVTQMADQAGAGRS